MAKIRKTSKYGKRKIKPLPPVVKPVYPEYIQTFIDKVELPEKRITVDWQPDY